MTRRDIQIADESKLGRSEDGETISRTSLIQELMASGVRMTAQRRLLVGIIQTSSRHLDAASLLQEARKHDPTIDRATIYRTISLLKDRGLIDELDLIIFMGKSTTTKQRQVATTPIWLVSIVVRSWNM